MPRRSRHCAAAGTHVTELRRTEPERPAALPLRRAPGLALRAGLLALAAGYGLLHARDLAAPALSLAALAAVAALAVAPALLALRLGRRAGLLALAPAALAAAWIAAGDGPSPRAPLGGLGGLLADAPASWVEVVLPFAGGEHPELRALVLSALFAWLAVLAWLWIARPRPLAAALVALLPFALSATVYGLGQSPWRALAAGALLLAFLLTGRAAGGGRPLAAALASLALALGAAWAAVPAASHPAVLPWTEWTFSQTADATAVGLAWDMRYQPLVYPPEPVEVLEVRAPRPSYWRALVLERFDGLRFTRTAPEVVARSERGGTVELPAAPVWARLGADVHVAALADSYLVAPGQPVRYVLPAEAGAVDLAADATAELRSDPEPGLDYRSEGIQRDPAPAALRALPPAYPRGRRASGLSLRGRDHPGLRPGRARAAARRALRCASRRSRVAGVADGLPEGAQRDARRGLAVPGRRGAGGLAAHHACLRRARRPARTRPMRSRAGRPRARPATARCSPPRWPPSCASRAYPRGSPRASRRATAATARTA